MNKNTNSPPFRPNADVASVASETVHPNIDQSKLIRYLDEFGKQLSNRRTSSTALEEQLMSLSKAYNLAQEKLLDTERVLMNESILVEKQRSLLEVLSAATKIYKYILSEAMEDESILTFISHIQEDAHSQSNSPNNSLNNSRNYSHCQQEIKDQLAEIVTLITRKKNRGRKASEEIKELRREISRLREQLVQSKEKISQLQSQKYEMTKIQEQLQSKINDNTRSQTMANIEYDNLRRELEALKTDFTALRQHNQELQGQIHTLQVDKLGLAEQAESNEKTGQFITAVVKFINTFMGKSDQENIMTLSSNDKPRLSEQLLRTLTDKLSIVAVKLAKIEKKNSKMKAAVSASQFMRNQISILKLFLSNEALTVLKQYESSRLQCLQNQLRNLSVFEKNQLIRLQECEQEVWRCRAKLLREQCLSKQFSEKMVPLSARTQFLSPGSSENKCQQKPVRLLSEERNDLSQFDA